MLRQLGHLQARPSSPPPHQVWRETHGGGSRARHWVDVYGPQLLDWARRGSPAPTDASEEDEVDWAAWIDREFSSLMIFHRSHFLGRGNLPLGDIEPGEAVVSRAALLEEVQSSRTQLEIAVSF